MAFAQSVASLQAKLSGLSIMEGGYWDKQISVYHTTVLKVGMQKQLVSDQEKVTKLICTVSVPFDYLKRASSLGSKIFDDIIMAVAANIERHKEIGNWVLHDSVAAGNKVNLIDHDSSSNSS